MQPAGVTLADLYSAELRDRLSALAHPDTVLEPLPGVRIRHATAPTEFLHGLTYPALCVAAQGSKVTEVGGREFRYNPGHYLITTTTLPSTSRILEASPEQPYLGIVLRLEPALVSEVMLASGQIDAPSALPVQAIGSAPVGEDLLGAVMRVARLAELPAEADFLLPPVMREIVYRLLMGEQGARLRHVAAAGGASHRIAEAIARLREEYDRPLRIGALARDLGMSVSAFHHHFKSVTAMSPLQFQKRLRLQEARRLMLGEGYDATTAGLSVGYDDASHFSREYKRLFGEPPMRDVARMRDAVMEPAAL